MKHNTGSVQQVNIERRIFLIRGQKMMLSVHLAGLYGVETRALIQAVKHNRKRFPGDFMFQLSHEESRSLRSQLVTLEESSSRRGRHPKYRPYAFAEQGVAMLSSVLISKRAVQVNIEIMRGFVRLREILATHPDKVGARKLEKKYDAHTGDKHRTAIPLTPLSPRHKVVSLGKGSSTSHRPLVPAREG